MRAFILSSVNEARCGVDQKPGENYVNFINLFLVKPSIWTDQWYDIQVQKWKILIIPEFIEEQPVGWLTDSRPGD